MTHCRYPFMCSTTACEKCAAPDRFEAGSQLRKELASITRRGMVLGVVAFFSILSIGFGAAAIADQGWENIKNTRIANVEP